MMVFQSLFFCIYIATVLAGAALWYGSVYEPVETPDFSAALEKVLPSFDNQPEEESFESEGLRIFPARSERQVALEGTDQVITASSLSGFAFLIPDQHDSEGINPFLVGLNMEGEITGAQFLLKEQFRLPENRISSRILADQQKFFQENRALLIEKASEGTAV